MLVSFEGIDGSGKSTQVERLRGRLLGSGHRVEILREPGGTIVSERIRDLLLDDALHVEPFAELLLFSAARAQLVSERIRPLLDEGCIVVCDRFFDSTTAYQGGGRGLADPAWLDAFHRRVTGGLVPDRTYLLAVSPGVGAARRTDRRADRMEQAGDAFLERVQAAYRDLAAAEPDRILLLHGDADPDAIAARIWSDLEPRLPR
jgi:dTMP kinase